MRIPDDAEPGLYITLWTNGKVKHGARMVEPSDTVPSVPFLPWKRHAELTDVARALWAGTGNGVVSVVVPKREDDIKRMQKLLWKDMRAITGPIACQQCGILRGGGVAHSGFACHVRLLPELEKIYRWLCEDVLGRKLPKELVVAWDGALWTSTSSAFETNDIHLDNKGADYIQCEVILWPRFDFDTQSSTLRVGILTSFLEPSDKRCYNGLLSIACRHSQMETGELHRSGPRARPVPPTVLGGPILKKAEGLKLTAEELAAFIKQHVTNQVLKFQAAKYLRLHSAGRPAVAHKRTKSFESDLNSQFQPIDEKTLARLYRGADVTEYRGLVVRALLGGLSQNRIRQHVSSASITSEAAAAIARAKEEQNAEVVNYFVAQGNKVGKRAKLS